MDPSAKPKEESKSPQDDPFFDEYPFDLGDYQWNITGNDEARRWATRGLAWMYGYHFEEAIVLFSKALSVDPDCGMAAWGLVVCHSPNYNLHIRLGYYGLASDPEREAYPSVKQAHDALSKALERKDRGIISSWERMCIEALEKCTKWPIPEDKSRLGHDYADAMRKVYQAFPQNLEVVTTFIISLMSLYPWNMFNSKTSQPNPEAEAVVKELDHMFEIAFQLEGSTKHIGLLHMHIHYAEMQRERMTPEKFRWSADRMREIAPRSLGHLHHMPTHIYIQVGEYKKSIESNLMAIKADYNVIEYRGTDVLYSGYLMHNHEFAVWAGMLSARKQACLDISRSLFKGKNQEASQEENLFESRSYRDYCEMYLALDIIVYIRFGMWNYILENVKVRTGEDREKYAACTAFALLARALGHATLGHVAEARKEQTEFLGFIKESQELQTRRKHVNNAPEIMRLASKFLEGEILYREEKYEEAFSTLEEAVGMEDNLPYDEPAGWLIPVRHALGALLEEQGHYERAEKVLLDDLAIYPKNIWALRNYVDVLTKQNKEPSEKVLQDLKQAQEEADILVSASCSCAVKKWKRGDTCDKK